MSRLLREVTKQGQGTRTDLGDNVTEVDRPERGNSHSYTLDRLHQQRLQIHNLQKDYWSPSRLEELGWVEL